MLNFDIGQTVLIYKVGRILGNRFVQEGFVTRFHPGDKYYEHDSFLISDRDGFQYWVDAQTGFSSNPNGYVAYELHEDAQPNILWRWFFGACAIAAGMHK